MENQTQKNNFLKSPNNPDPHFVPDLHSVPENPLSTFESELSYSDGHITSVDRCENALSQEEASESIQEGRLTEMESGNSFRTEEEQLLKLERQLEQIERQQQQRLIRLSNSLNEDTQKDNDDNFKNNCDIKDEEQQQILEEGQLQLNEKATSNISHQKQLDLWRREQSDQKELISSDSSQKNPKEDTAVTIVSETAPIEAKEQLRQSDQHDQVQNTQLLTQKKMEQPRRKISDHLEPIAQEISKPLQQINQSLGEVKKDLNTENAIKFFQKPEAIQELTQGQVLEITENLETMLQLFKSKLPNMEEINIIQSLYDRYIAPHKASKKVGEKLSSQKNHDKLSAKVADEHTILEHSEYDTTFSQKQKMNSSVLNLLAQKQMVPIKIPPPATAQQAPQKRAYTKRGGQGDQNPRFMQQQRVAKLFIKKGYGLQVARQHLGSNIQNNYYTNLVTTIIRQTWRKVQDYISRFRRITIMDNNSFKVIKTSLVNCVKWMDSADLSTYYQFMKVLYQMDNRMPYEDQAIRFYNNCIKRYDELRKPYETQNKIRQEKKIVQKLKDMDSPNIPKPTSVTRAPSQHRFPKKSPSQSQLEDLTSLIKSQLRQNVPIQRPYVPLPPPSRPIHYQPPPMMMRHPPPPVMGHSSQTMNYSRPMPPSMNGQRF